MRSPSPSQHVSEINDSTLFLALFPLCLQKYRIATIIPRAWFVHAFDYGLCRHALAGVTDMPMVCAVCADLDHSGEYVFDFAVVILGVSVWLLCSFHWNSHCRLRLRLCLPTTGSNTARPGAPGHELYKPCSGTEASVYIRIHSKRC